MPPFKPINRRELIHYLRLLAFEGPFSGGRHQFMIKGKIVLRIPNPHKGDIGKELLKRILKQAKIDLKRWEEL